MDPRRVLSLAARLAPLALASPGFGGCAGLALAAKAPPASAGSTAPPGRPAAPASPAALFTSMAPIPDPAPGAAAASERGRTPGAATGGSGPSNPPSGPEAIAVANRRSRETSRADAFVGGVQVFAYAPGRVYEVWTAPLRVTTLTLAPGEAILSKAAGDTVRWQIGETASGQGTAQRAHVMIKPLERGLETNLVLATSRRVYLLQLRSGRPEAFNAAVTWDLGALLPASDDRNEAAGRASVVGVPSAGSSPSGQAGLAADFRIVPRGRRPAWTPTSVMTDGTRTYLTFPAGVTAQAAPVLLVHGPGGAPEVVNYRQQGRLWVVDRAFDVAELRLGVRRPQVVRILRDPRAGGGRR